MTQGEYTTRLQELGLSYRSVGINAVRTLLQMPADFLLHYDCRRRMTIRTKHDPRCISALELHGLIANHKHKQQYVLTPLGVGYLVRLRNAGMIAALDHVTVKRIFKNKRPLGHNV